MRIAILGATSQIAKDLIYSFSDDDDCQLTLFARRPQLVSDWLINRELVGKYAVRHFTDFSKSDDFDALINFVGVGNPAQVGVIGSSIFDITYAYDTICLEYLKQNPSCRYIFLSSGAAYGSFFLEPVTQDSFAAIPINNIQPQDWYGVAKLHAESRHRALPQFNIVDLRIFNYFSHTQDMAARFLITDIVRAIRDKTTLITSADFIIRDFLHPFDFYQLVNLILKANPTNTALDCFTLEPVDKPKLLLAMQENFGLQYQIIDGPGGVNATGSKPYYYSLNKKALQFGYLPEETSLSGLSKEIESYLRLDSSC